MFFITAIKHLRIAEPLGRGFQIRDGFFLMNDLQFLQKKIPKDAVTMMGTNEYLDILDCGTAMFYEVPQEAESIFAEDTKKALTLWMLELLTFYQSLWLIKDNSVNNELGFCIFDHPTENDLACTSNFLYSPLTNSSGTTAHVNFTLSELRQAREYFTKLHPATFDRAGQVKGRDGGTLDPRSQQGKRRFPRFHNFVGGARMNHYLPLKITSFMTCFEILFSTTAAELTHKLSERVAFFLGKDPTERKAIFNRMKAAYAVRSKTVHGDDVEAGEKLAATSVEIDNLVRRIFLKILGDEQLRKVFEKDRNSLEEYFSDLILGLNDAK